ncbi:MAG: SseB family protein [Myxococcales bacterium]|nr:MAG: SseB family protein [Myxococcales bacterium]
MGESPTVRTIPDPGFPDDDGSGDPELTSFLARYDVDPDGLHGELLTRLTAARLLVPVVAVLGEVEYDDQGLAHDKTSDMASVLMTGRDGRKALLAFTSNETLTRWNPEARPVPVSAGVAALSALQDKADALVVDIAGPVLFAIEGSDLRLLAASRS